MDECFGNWNFALRVFYSLHCFCRFFRIDLIIFIFTLLWSNCALTALTNQFTSQNMITLNRKLKKEHTEPTNGITMEPVQRRISIRDKLLVKEVQEMNENLPVTCSVSFEDPNVLSEFVLTVTPDEGYWQGGTFKFSVSVTEEYNMAPPRVKCQTRLWHPNINVDGEICLSLLRLTSIDEHGWAPTRRLKDVVWGLNSLFTDLLNFDDPLNIEAAEMYNKNKLEFQSKVTEYIGKNKR